jgi:hypothetical protein
MERITAKQVRFAKIVETGGKPEAYLPFGDPETDKAFMRAADEVKVVTIRQEPTSKRKDFGIVGYVKERYATYLVFPKSLRAFAGHRVVGIDYSVLESADVRIGGKVPGRAKAPEKRKAARDAEVSKPKEAKPKKKPEPEPKRFTVELAVTTTERKRVEVTAWNAAEAKAQALRETQTAPQFDKERMSAKIVVVRSRGG